MIWTAKCWVCLLWMKDCLWMTWIGEEHEGLSGAHDSVARRADRDAGRGARRQMLTAGDHRRKFGFEVSFHGLTVGMTAEGFDELRIIAGLADVKPVAGWDIRQRSLRTVLEVVILTDQGELVTVQAAADRLAVSRWMIYRLIWDQQLKSVQIGRCRRIIRRSLDDYVAGLIDGAA
jgi:excisionase family DNA binding protein